ncbi:MAG: trypsin-like peptidase domain-containing protein [Candidatus Eremiobacteraeota bacterium]|nr:trypsin-like peptidase domain-containing protein [Candidatus Eremiobacteraeota bacterium]
MRAAVAAAAFAALIACSGARGDQGTAVHADPFVAAYDRLHPSVVLFTMKIPADDPKRKGEWDDAYGSGVVVESGSWGSRILIDAHVSESAKNLVATIGDGPHAPARVVATTGADEDLAIVDVPLKNQRPVKLGSIAHLEPGTAIGVLGYPIPDAFEDEHLGRTVSLYTGRVASVRKGAPELDVSIIPGESGGPVFDAQTGDVIGIAESRFEEERAIGFATPIDEATRFLAAHARIEAAVRR